MLQQLRTFGLNKPFEMWVISSAVMLAIFNTGYLLIPGTRNPVLHMYFSILALSGPATILVHRFSNNFYNEHPVSQSQEIKIGAVSIGSVFLSAISLILGMSLTKPHGGQLADTIGMYSLAWFAFFMLFAIKMGYVARRCIVGRIGMIFTGVWFFGFPAAMIVLSLFVRLSKL